MVDEVVDEIILQVVYCLVEFGVLEGVVEDLREELRVVDKREEQVHDVGVGAVQQLTRLRMDHVLFTIQHGEGVGAGNGLPLQLLVTQQRLEVREQSAVDLYQALIPDLRL